MRAFIYLLKRELWEHRAIWMVPGVFAALLATAAMWGTGWTLFHHGDMVGVHTHLNDATGAKLAVVVAGMMAAPAAPFNIFLLGVTFFYLLDSLYGDRRDRSVLFWKSLPVSDLHTVLSKLVTALVVIPLAVTAIIAALDVVMLILSAITLGSIGGHGWGLLAHPIAMLSAWFAILLFYVVQALWFFPIYGWLMLASSWARKAPFLWAVVPPLALILVERMALGTHHFANLLGHHFGHLYLNVFDEASLHDLSVQLDDERLMIGQGGNPLSVLRIGQILGDAGLYGGLVVGGVFLAGATWLRRYRDES